MAVLKEERCKPNDCGIPCYRFCPEVQNRRYAITFPEDRKKAIIVEDVCTGCGICIQKCPYDAISIVNLPEELETAASHRYGENTFKLFRLPVPQEGLVTGLIGRNGTGKSTALRILSGELVPNLGEYDNPPSWQDVIRRHRGSILQEYFSKLSQGKLKLVHKPQYVDKIAERVKGTVGQILAKVDERGKMKQLIGQLHLDHLGDRTTNVLSGGELQRVAIAAAVGRDADVYIFDEPSSHLDVRERLAAARAIRTLIDDGKTVLLAEHDLAMLDYLSDQVCLIYGDPGVYGIVSHVHGVRDGINIYLEGHIADENMRFRDEPIRFHVRPPREASEQAAWEVSWGRMKKKLGSFELTVEPGSASAGEVIGVLGPNGIGKTTFVKLLSGTLKPDSGELPSWTGMTVSYKPQYISAEYSGSVKSLLSTVAGERFGTQSFENEFIKPLGLNQFTERTVTDLSGGELQRVAIAVCLAKQAQIYLLDEPSAYLDVEERLATARLIRKTVENYQSFAFVVEHDIVTQDFMADRLMVFDGEPGVQGVGRAPSSLRQGMNAFLELLDLTFRRDPTSGRPRVNKAQSKLDREQKEIGEYYYAAAAE